MQVVFRADASLRIGSGHVMRCLTLAHALRAEGADCIFVCREHPGNLLAQIRARGFSALALPEESDCAFSAASSSGLTHQDWLGCSWQADADQTKAALQGTCPDWVVVDHYALDARWETAIRPVCRHIMAIDDLADRPHDCDVLLDQNLGRSEADYAKLVPAHCTTLAGPAYALLRPEFAELRSYSLERRRNREAMTQVLITMGGVDQQNATGAVLQALSDGSCLPRDCRITVVMGALAPWLGEVKQLALRSPLQLDVVVNVDDMAMRMADSDIVIGAAGGTAWERCCLGVPSLLVVLAVNQWPGARALAASGAAKLVGEPGDIPHHLRSQLLSLGRNGVLQRLSACASGVTDGHGVTRLTEVLGRSCQT